MSINILITLDDMHLKVYMLNTAQQFTYDIDDMSINNSDERWQGIVSFAESLGYTVTSKGTHYHGNLGSWIKCFSTIDLQSSKEKRICNGIDKPIWVYPTHIPSVRTELERLITEFFKHPNPNQRLREAGWFKNCNR